MPDKYQARALRTWHRDLDPVLQMMHATLGLVGEAGEFSELIKKDWFKPGRLSTREERLGELGDVFYYLCILASLDGVTIDELSEMNAAKLADGHGWKPDYCAFF